jgi:Bacterial surface protein, Ig-like domain/HYR domain/FlgD Ig-like domain/PKD domain
MKTSSILAFLLGSGLLLTGLRAFADPLLTSDKLDYFPGETATFIGSGFQPGENVEMLVVHADTVSNTGEDHGSWVVAADEQGSFVTTWHVCTDDCAGSTLRATADGVTSGLHAGCMFTDAPVPAFVTVTTGLSCALAGSFQITYKPPTGNNVTVTGTTPQTFAVKTNTDFTVTLIQGVVNGTTYTGPATITGSSGGDNSTTTVSLSYSDTTPPSLALNGASPMTVECHSAFSDPGATASDACAGDLTGSIQVSGSVDPNTPGSYTLTYSVSDGSNNASLQRTVNVVDTTPPSLALNGAVQRFTGPDATTCGVVIPDAELGTASASDLCAGTLNVVRSGVPAGNLFPVGASTISFTTTDGVNVVTGTQIVTVVDNTPPVLAPMSNILRLPDLGSCAAAVTFAPSATDNCSNVTVVTSPPSGFSFPLGTTVVTCTATDAAGNQAVSTFSVTIQNPAPAVAITGPASGAIFPIGTPVAFSGSFTDNAGDVHTAQWTFDAVTASGTVNETLKAVADSYTFSSPGIYFVRLTVTDQCGGTATATRVNGFDAMVVIYDPNAGFVTGGGWITSPIGSYAANPSLAGRANFGFVSKYAKGASVPTGETEFQFQLGNLNFHSTSYDWLVVVGAKGQFKGSGTVNGVSGYGFLLSAVDGQVSGGGGTDKFRMKIIDKVSSTVVYDNQMGAADSTTASTALAGGSIVIHGSNKGGPGSAGALVDMSPIAPIGFLLAQNSPNPFHGATQVRFRLPAPSRVELSVYDIAGREVTQLAAGDWTAGEHTVTWSGRTQDGNAAHGGVYFVRLTAQPEGSSPHTATRKMLLLN